jgi:hypothetical protein
MGSFYRINHYLMKDNGNVFLIYWALFLVFYTPAQESFSLEPSHFCKRSTKFLDFHHDSVHCKKVGHFNTVKCTVCWSLKAKCMYSIVSLLNLRLHLTSQLHRIASGLPACHNCISSPCPFLRNVSLLAKGLSLC